MTNIIFSMILAATIYGEASIDTMAGKRHIAGVAYNHTEEYTRNGVPLWQAINAACLRPGRFTCWTKGFDIDYDSQAWRDSVQAAYEVEISTYRSPTKATHYHSSKMKRFPPWSKKMQYLGRVGSHLFYKEWK